MSNDLISRGALINQIESERRVWGEEYDAEQILGDIKDMPTAYDPDKVVDQIKCLSPGNYVDRNKTIEIVKGGGVDA